ncbi:phosphate transport system substrate-binding protein [Amylolactobacillus amylotrophicus DSM 20534]|uniref:Phosphate-binding protein n=3 Tax=Amylolactobacillus TaxID=2767876 RepID=A0A0R1YJ99_9LACO|nr:MULTISPECIES: phosphate ABC transporter substrate-binding protein [Amylolactobacillus]APT18944.1 phosphate ABC transporter substrate-binding protein [Amylolactobacillus amylophilus DSM 20533 = JCM 1125]KRK38797.1 phosphate transport system substrate-binding protein [Amylolactobacillus amylotrophicus DSM 20534]KRM42560.1 phosphate transport system substrate-binding protein [Amylolactobacillus amylophilus DSM 20533 = JCM 1125]GED80018.1 phosphate-binding protein [Amylolactobacillus amylophilus
MRKKFALLFLITILTTVLSACSLEQKGEVVSAVGSSALQPLVEAAGEQFTKQHPSVYINVQGGGSGTGLAQIQAGAVDIGNSDLYAEQKSGIDATKIVGQKVAVVGITPIVNKSLGVASLSLAQLRDIFLGKITNWRDVGGPNLKIVLVNRAQGSGTRVAFEDSVLEGQQPVNAQEQDSNGMVRRIIASTKGAISYVAFSYVNDTVKTVKLNSVAPTQKNVTTNAWPLWAYEHMYVSKKPTQSTKKFMQFIMSDTVQNSVVNKMGYIAIKDMQVERSMAGQVTKIK